MERLICWAVLVQTKGRGFWFQPSTKRVIARSSCATLSKLPRRIACWLISQTSAPPSLATTHWWA